MIPYGRQSISDADVEAVVAALRSDFLTQGPIVPGFERAVRERVGARFAVATNSATSALHLACLALEVGPGDRVWTSPITFVASANCALYCGAVVEFVDIDPDSFNMSVDRLAEMLVLAEQNGTLPKVVIPVHMAGRSCDMAAISRLAGQYGFRVIEDASHAIGGDYRNRPVGDCRFSDITVFSFHPVKIVTTAEGGLALTNDEALGRRLDLLRSHGITRDPALMSKESDGAWYYEQIGLGFNFRMTELQGALGRSQLERIDAFIGRRRALATRYREHLTDVAVRLPPQDGEAVSSWHLYVIRIDSTRTNIDRRHVFDALRGAGIGVNVHYIPVYLQPYYQSLGYRPGLCPAAERYYSEAISIPLFPGMTDVDQDYVIEHLERTVAK